MNFIIEEIKVSDLEGQVEILRTVKTGNRLRNQIDKIDYKLKKSDENLSSDFLKIFISEISNLEVDKVKFNLNRQSFFKRLFKKNTIVDLLELISKKKDKCSWIIAPKWIIDNLDISKLEGVKILSYLSNRIFLGNYNSVTLLRNENNFHFIQNDFIREIEIV
jgi:hypothetical protein